ncbi:MAG: hypothetical protein P1S59_13865 [bacterium]|nr:hypothetical protein [bacterium]
MIGSDHSFKGVFKALVLVLPMLYFAPLANAAPPAHPGTVIIPPEKRSERLNRPIRAPKKNRKIIKSKSKDQGDNSSGKVESLGIVPLAAVPLPGISTTETIQPLFLLLSFTDQAFSTTIAANYPAFLYSDSPGFADYYRVVSGGRLELESAAVGSVVIVDMPQSYSYYVSSQSGFGTYPWDHRGMVEDALDHAYTVSGVDFSEFDNDGPDGVPGSLDDDGVLDALVIVHAGPAA